MKNSLLAYLRIRFPHLKNWERNSQISTLVLDRLNGYEVMHDFHGLSRHQSSNNLLKSWRIAFYLIVF